MDTFKVIDRNGKAVGEVKVAKELAEASVNTQLVHEVVVGYRRNARQGTASTKNRSRVKGSGAKAWRQKGTGRARSGSRKNPIWRGGGVIFGPNPRDLRKTIPRGQRRNALASAVADKVKDGAVVVVDKIVADPPKTKAMAEWLGAIGADRKPLIVVGSWSEDVWKAARNIPGADVVPLGELNARILLLHGKLVMEKGDFELLQERLI